MVYLFLNKSKLLNPLIDMVKDKYGDDAIMMYSDGLNKSFFATEPFWGDKWLLVLSNPKSIKKDLMHLLLCSNKVDLLIEVSSNQVCNDIIECFLRERGEILSKKAGSRFNYFFELDPSEQEIKEYFNSLKIKLYSAYKMPDEYYDQYCKYILLNGKEKVSWSEAKNVILTGESATVLKYIANNVRGNEEYVTGVLELLEPEDLDITTIVTVSKNVKTREFVNVYNYALFGLSKVFNRTKEVKRVLYSSNKLTIIKQFKEFLKNYGKIYEEYISGEFNKLNMLNFIRRKGKQFNIQSDFMAKEWLGCLEHFSYEKYLICKSVMENKEMSVIDKYGFIVKLF